MKRAATFMASTPYRVREGGYEVDADPARFDLDMVHGFLTTCYWCAGIPREVVARSIAGSLCLGVYEADTGAQVAFARAITDAATYAYLADVFVLESHRGKGVGKLLMRAIMGHPDLQGLRRWMLLTRDAHGLYQQYGFRVSEDPERVMEIRDPDVYRRATQASGA